MQINEKYYKKLLVEGNDDQHVIWAFCQKFSLTENFDVIDCRGIEQLYSQIPVRFKQAKIDTIGIIVDADADLNTRWNYLKNLLSQQGFNLPDDIPAAGLIITNKSAIKAGVWIMPNNNINGMLEDFISFLVPEEDNLWPVAVATLENIENQHLNRYMAGHKPKAKIHTWLSWQEDPGTPLGLSITKKYLTTDREISLQFVNWLKVLFNT
jgi:hypothetical protein